MAGTVHGWQLAAIRATAAAPIAIFTVRESVVAVAPAPLVVLVLLPAPPDDAVIVAVPEAVPARNLTVTRPLTSVCASDG
jgi:hypothetical protein